MLRPITEEDDQLAAKIVDRALEDFDFVADAETLEALRALLEAELVATQAGQRMLRAAKPDPVVAQSNDVALPGVTPLRTPATKKR